MYFVGLCSCITAGSELGIITNKMKKHIFAIISLLIIFWDFLIKVISCIRLNIRFKFAALITYWPPEAFNCLVSDFANTYARCKISINCQFQRVWTIFKDFFCKLMKSCSLQIHLYFNSLRTQTTNILSFFLT